jgi:hypothetical protein
LIPALGALTFILLLLAALYGIYLLWLGLPVLLKSPQDKAIAYTSAVAASAIIVYIIFSKIIGALFAHRMM